MPLKAVLCSNTNLIVFFADVFFIYEPLDALYSTMYGTPAGWNVPSDIFYDSSGEQRLTHNFSRFQYYFYHDFL